MVLKNTMACDLLQFEASSPLLYYYVDQYCCDNNCLLKCAVLVAAIYYLFCLHAVTSLVLSELEIFLQTDIIPLSIAGKILLDLKFLHRTPPKNDQNVASGGAHLLIYI